MREALTDWQGMLRQETGPARQAFRALPAWRLVFTPEERDGERFYAFEGPGSISPHHGRSSKDSRITTMIYTHVLNRGPATVRSPLDRMLTR
jgi:hypothetical protein